jgi:polyhydroxyalkanoate synthase subunit PhaC
MGSEVIATGQARAGAVSRPTAARVHALTGERAALVPTGRRGADWLNEANPLHELLPIDWTETAWALTTLFARSLRDPVHAAAGTTALSVRLWQEAAESLRTSAAHFWGVLPWRSSGPSGDRRFDALEWELHPYFNVLKRIYFAVSQQLLADGEAAALDDAERQRLVFHLRQLVDATSPTVYFPTNPAALRRAWETGGASIMDGLRNLFADLRAGRLSITDTEAFRPGKNLALTPGKVVHRNELIELIQYVPLAPASHVVPLLFIPPWINKFYILDLQPKNSLVRFLLEQGFAVFMISWKNPDASMEDIGFEDYMAKGPLAATDVVREICDTERVNPVGYCIGGTLLAMTLAALAARGDERFGPATFMVSLVDFADVGDTAVFVDEPQIEFMERRMLERGYLDSRQLSNMFNLLRANDLIWSTVVNNYLLGNKPAAFDLLYWNSDGTRMARRAHSYYLRNTYLQNNLIKPGKLSLLGAPIDLRRIRQDIYAVGAEKDHIVPWATAWRIARLTGAKTRFVLAASGHIVGMINPPSAGKGYWTNDDDSPPPTPAVWLNGAEKHEGSWWTDWISWLSPRSGEKRPGPPVGSSRHSPLCDAPGTYVLEK